MTDLREYLALLNRPSLPSPVRRIYDIVPPPGNYDGAYQQTLAWLRGRSTLHPALIEVAMRIAPQGQRAGASIFEAADGFRSVRAAPVSGVSSDAVAGVANALVVRANDPDARASRSR